MKLKCETILDIYTHRNLNVLCQIKVQSSKDNKQQKEGWQNTCRSITPKQWNSFDKEVNILIKELRHKRDKCNDEIIFTFSIKPNIEVKVQKSKLSSKMFYNIMGHGGVDDSGSVGGHINNKNIQQIGYVLEFIWEFKPQPPISPVKETQEYQPETTSPDNKPLSYEPYTPSKKENRASSLEKETQKYEPQSKTSPDNICSNPPSYKPYTPSKKENLDNSLEKETQKYEPQSKTSPDNICSNPPSYKPYTPSKKENLDNSLEKETQKYEPNPKTLSANSGNNPPSYEPYTSSKKNHPVNSLEKETQKYEPNSKTLSSDNICNSPLLSYEPYTPSKKKYRANSLDGIKTPGVDFLEHESLEDAYLPKAIMTFPIPAYKPAPIKEKLASNDTQISKHSCNKDEVKNESDKELFSPMKFRTLRSKVSKEKTKHEIEYIPKSQDIINAPEYFPTPIDTKKETIKIDSQKDKNNDKDKKQIIETVKEDSTPLTKQSKRDYHKYTQKNVRKRISKRLDRDKLFSDESNQDKEDIDKPRIVEKASAENLCVLNVPSTTESATKDVSSPIKNTKENPKFSHHDNLERSPIKPKRLREEKSSKNKNKKKLKTQKCSPTNTELFGSDDDDEDNKRDESNNEAFNKKSSIYKDLFDDEGDDSNNNATNNKSSILHRNIKILKNTHIQPHR